MRWMTLDCETTTFQKGNAYSRCNRIVSIGVKTEDTSYIVYADDKHFKENIQDFLNNTELLVGFNIKFDLGHLKRYGFTFDHLRIWDCQLAEFLLSYQQYPYPSLNKVAERYGLGTKLDIVKEEYWDKDIDTHLIPRDILNEYLQQDLDLTTEVFFKQQPLLKEHNMMPLFKLQCADLLVLQQMEFNGMLLDVAKAEELAKETEIQVKKYEELLAEGYEDKYINWNSRDHLSCYLYGGTITYETRLEIGVYKTGAKVGQPRYKILNYSHTLPRLVEPPKDSELLKEGYYATDDPTLRNIRAGKQVKQRINNVLLRSQSNKLLGTYYKGLPILINTMDWRDGYLHGTFNQCVAATGRLSSTRPNLQNFAGEIKGLLTSRY